MRILKHLYKNKAPRYQNRTGIPKSWNEITIQDFIALDKIVNTDESEFAKRLAIVKYFFGKDAEGLTVGELGKKRLQLSFLNEAPENTHFPPVFYFNDKKYLVAGDIKKWQSWQCIGASDYFKAGGINNLHYLCACLMVPDSQGDHSLTVEERAKEFLQLPYIVAHGLSGFFLANLEALSKATLIYLEKKQAKMSKD